MSKRIERKIINKKNIKNNEKYRKNTEDINPDITDELPRFKEETKNDNDFNYKNDIISKEEENSCQTPNKNIKGNQIKNDDNKNQLINNIRYKEDNSNIKDDEKSNKMNEKKEKDRDSEEKLKLILTEILKNSLRENTIRIQKEFNRREFSANDYLINLESIVIKYINYNHDKKSRWNFYLNIFLNYLGYKHKSNIKNINFFHFASQSWIIEVFTFIKKKFLIEYQTNNETSKINFANYTYSEIFCEIINYQVLEKRYLANLEILAGNSYFSDVAIKLSELRFAKYFLQNINLVCNNAKNETVFASLSKVEFEDKLMNILILAMETTLNMINGGRDSYNQKEMNKIRYAHYLKYLRDKKLTVFNYENYLKELKNDHLLNINNDEEDIILKSSDAFFYFASINFKDLINDLNLLINICNNSLDKLGIIFKINQEKLYNLYSRFKNNYYNRYSQSKSNEFILDKLSINYLEKLVSYLRVINLKNVYNPIQNSKFSIKSSNFYLSISKNSSLYFSDLKKMIIEKTKNNYNFLIDQITNQNLFDIYIEKESIIITISRKILLSNKKTIYSLLQDISQWIDIKEKTRYLYGKAIEKTLFHRDNLIEKYKRFFTNY